MSAWNLKRYEGLFYSTHVYGFVVGEIKGPYVEFRVTSGDWAGMRWNVSEHSAYGVELRHSLERLSYEHTGHRH